MVVIQVRFEGSNRLALMPQDEVDSAALAGYAAAYGLTRHHGVWVLPLAGTAPSPAVLGVSGGGGSGGGIAILSTSAAPTRGDTVMFVFKDGDGVTFAERPAIVMAVYGGDDVRCDLHVFFRPDDSERISGTFRESVPRKSTTFGHLCWRPR